MKQHSTAPLCALKTYVRPETLVAVTRLNALLLGASTSGGNKLPSSSDSDKETEEALAKPWPKYNVWEEEL